MKSPFKRSPKLQVGKPNGRGSVPADKAAAGDPAQRITIASNTVLRQVAFVLGDPQVAGAPFLTFTPAVARQIGKALMEEADRAEGK